MHEYDGLATFLPTTGEWDAKGRVAIARYFLKDLAENFL